MGKIDDIIKSQKKKEKGFMGKKKKAESVKDVLRMKQFTDGQLVITTRKEDFDKELNDLIEDRMDKYHEFGDVCIWCNNPVVLTLTKRRYIELKTMLGQKVYVLCEPCSKLLLRPQNILSTPVIKGD